MTTNQILWG